MPIFRDRQAQRGLQVNYSESDIEVTNDEVALSEPAGIVDQLLGFGLRGITRGRTGGAERVRPGGVTVTAPVIGEFKNVIIS